jgi:hypothetical protein
MGSVGLGGGEKADEMMTQTEAKMRILAEWRARMGSQPRTAGEALIFFGDIQQNHPELLSFQSKNEDKWQKVRAWLSNAGLIKD